MVTESLFNQGRILGVSRKTNRKDFGLAGGKLEAKETFKEAAFRGTNER